MSELVGCSSCSRHVRSSATACPFCGATTAAVGPTVQRRALVGAARAAVFAAVLLAPACSGDSSPSTDAGTDATLAPPYGAAPPDDPTRLV